MICLLRKIKICWLGSRKGCVLYGYILLRKKDEERNLSTRSLDLTFQQVVLIVGDNYLTLFTEFANDSGIIVSSFQ